ncbi:MAG: hypothetical protein IPJ08_07715 [Burkholderiales bacterium]|nr:hypothetical protein [Burkholderiales bacterium]
MATDLCKDPGSPCNGSPLSAGGAPFTATPPSPRVTRLTPKTALNLAASAAIEKLLPTHGPTVKPSAKKASCTRSPGAAPANTTCAE